MKIVLTGGPGGGKTTAADLFRRELGDDVMLVPEAATLLFSGGFPRHPDANAICAAQRAIYYVQRGLEDTQNAHYPNRVLLCDRGTVDGAVYWPEERGGPEMFFFSVNSSMEEELARYDAVIFFQSASVGGHEIDGGNPIRVESVKEAAFLDSELHKLWSKHRRFIFVPNDQSFIKKINAGLNALQEIFDELRST